MTTYIPVIIACAITSLFIGVNWKKKNKREGYYFGLAIIFANIFSLTVVLSSGYSSLIHHSLKELESRGSYLSGTLVVKPSKVLRGHKLFFVQGQDKAAYAMSNRLKTGLVQDPESSPLNGTSVTAYILDHKFLISAYTKDGRLLYENMKSYSEAYGSYAFYMLCGFLISTVSLLRSKFLECTSPR